MWTHSKWHCEQIETTRKWLRTSQRRAEEEEEKEKHGERKFCGGNEMVDASDGKNLKRQTKTESQIM